MCCSSRKTLFAVILCGILRCTNAEYVVGLGADADTEDSHAFAALGSLGIGESSWLSATVSRNVSRSGTGNVETVYYDAGFDHHFDPLGVRFGIGYWGDADLLDSNDLRASLYWSVDKGSLSIDFERRAFDLTFRSPLLAQPRSVEFEADGIGFAARLQLSEVVSVLANGMRYDYSRNISLQPSVDVVRVFAVSRIGVTNSLLDERLSAGIEFAAGENVLDLRASSWRTAIFDDRVDSFSVGWLMPLTASSDLELRLSSDDADAFGRATQFSVFWYFYGE
ncbi:MAG: hypothetical protein KJN72_08305 [Woeseia sp.]|nr:hypothetical protein [Woeseia sp.]